MAEEGDIEKMRADLEEQRKARDALEETVSRLEEELKQINVQANLAMSAKDLEQLAVAAGSREVEDGEEALITKELLKPGDGETYPKEHETVFLHLTQQVDKQAPLALAPDEKPIEIVMGRIDLEPPYESCIMSMSLGEKARFVFNSLIVHGPGGCPKSDIPPNATITIEMEVVGIENLMCAGNRRFY